MYVTRPLSMYKKSPDSLSSPPPDGPNSGILVVQDDEAASVCCLGLFKTSYLQGLPLPQNKKLEISYVAGVEETKTLHFLDVVFIPVLDQPLSSNRYYAIKPHGRHKGKAYTSSKLEDSDTFCFFDSARDVAPEPLDPRNPYQQFEISIPRMTLNIGGSYTAKSMAPVGIPPTFLRKRGWQARASTPQEYELGEALGIDTALRARLPRFDFSISSKGPEPVVVGKWYCPFVFVREEPLKLRTSRSIYYEMTLEQKWERIFTCENDDSKSRAVVEVDVVVKNEVVCVGGREVLEEERNLAGGFMWLRGGGYDGGDYSLGLSMAIVERMRWEEERVGWVGGNEKEVNVKRVEEFGRIGEWSKFDVYVLMERFVLKRMDGSLVLTYDFRHIHQIRTKLE
ncbi:hypothetical protein SLA2020_231490 [Shorea laevis]